MKKDKSRAYSMTLGERASVVLVIGIWVTITVFVDLWDATGPPHLIVWLLSFIFLGIGAWMVAAWGYESAVWACSHEWSKGEAWYRAFSLPTIGAMALATFCSPRLSRSTAVYLLAGSFVFRDWAVVVFQKMEVVGCRRHFK